MLTTIIKITNHRNQMNVFLTEKGNNLPKSGIAYMENVQEMKFITLFLATADSLGNMKAKVLLTQVFILIES